MPSLRVDEGGGRHPVVLLHYTHSQTREHIVPSASRILFRYSKLYDVITEKETPLSIHVFYGRVAHFLLFLTLHIPAPTPNPPLPFLFF
jgi:hypothetical protein